jgi:hypothetical protein
MVHCPGIINDSYVRADLQKFQFQIIVKIQNQLYKKIEIQFVF